MIFSSREVDIAALCTYISDKVCLCVESVDISWLFSPPRRCPPQHLVQWDAGNSECLLQLVKELIQQYHGYQCERLRESSRLLFEYDSLLEDPDYGRSMEIYAGKKNSWVSETSHLLRYR